MGFKDLTEEMKGEIVLAIENALFKLGINTCVELYSETYSHSSNEYIKIRTGGFQTTPVIYKEVSIDGCGILAEVKGANNMNVYDLYLNLSYRFKYFNGGENGVDIGRVHFRVFFDTQRVGYCGFII